MILAISFKDILAIPFGYAIEGLHYLTNNVGLVMILLALTVSLLKHPLTVKARINSIKQNRLKPKVFAIRQMFPKDIDAQNAIMENMYKKEKVSLSFGFFASLLPALVLIMLFAAISHPMTYSLHVDKATTAGVIELLKGLEPAAFSSGYDEVIATNLIPKYAEEIKAAFPNISEYALQGMNFEFLGLNLAQTPTLNVASQGGATWANIGLLLIPCMAVIFTLLPVIISMVSRIVHNMKNPTSPKQGSKLGWLSAIMTLIFLILCFQVPASLCLYWASRNLFSFVLSFHVKAKVAQIPPDTTDLAALIKEYKLSQKQGA